MRKILDVAGLLAMLAGVSFADIAPYPEPNSCCGISLVLLVGAAAALLVEKRAV